MPRKGPKLATPCPTGKLKYRDALSAKLALARLENEDKPGHTEKRWYRCPLCFAFHLTSHRPMKRRRWEKRGPA